MDYASYSAHWKRMKAIEDTRCEVMRWRHEVEFLEQAAEVAWHGQRLEHAQSMLAHYTAKLIELRSTS